MHKNAYRSGLAPGIKSLEVGQGFTLGFAMTRGVYISPGSQWNPSEMKSERTTTWVSANINLF